MHRLIALALVLVTVACSDKPATTADEDIGSSASAQKFWATAGTQNDMGTQPLPPGEMPETDPYKDMVGQQKTETQPVS